MDALKSYDKNMRRAQDAQKYLGGSSQENLAELGASADDLSEVKLPRSASSDELRSEGGGGGGRGAMSPTTTTPFVKSYSSRPSKTKKPVLQFVHFC